MTRFTPKTEAALRAAGWYPGRDVSVEFEFLAEQELPPEIYKIFSEFGYLIIHSDTLDKVINKKTDTNSLLDLVPDGADYGLIWLDIDCSSRSNSLKTQIFGEGESLPQPDATTRQDIAALNKLFGLPFFRICGIQDSTLDIESDLYISKRGELFWINRGYDLVKEQSTRSPVALPGTFDDLLNYILDKSQSEKLWNRMITRHSKRFSAPLKEVLFKSGWHEGRDISNKLYFPPDKEPFPEALRLYKEFGYLDIQVNRRPPTHLRPEFIKTYKKYGEVLGFKGTASLNMSEIPKGADIFCLNKIEPPETLDDNILFQAVTEEKLTATSYLIKKLEAPCFVIGLLQDILLPHEYGWIIVTQTGEIYLSGYTLYKVAETFEEFLTRWFSLEEGMFWGQEIEKMLEED